MPQSNFYKYPSTGDAGEAAKQLQEVCNHFNVTWEHRFRQLDIIEINKSKLGMITANIGGNCQIFTNMYMHIRDLFFGFPKAARAAFKYWCFLNMEKLDSKLSEEQKNEKGKAIQKELKDILATNLTLQKRIVEYFKSDNGSQFDFATVAEQFWEYAIKLEKLQEGPYEDSEKVEIKRTDSSASLNTTFVSLDAEATKDLDLMHQINPDYYLTQSKDFNAKNTIELVEALTIGLFDSLNKEKEFRLLVTIKNKYGGAPHSLSFIHYLDDSKFIEFTDANRGIFLIPIDDKKKFQEFMQSYLDQKAYKQFNYQQLKMESYQKIVSKEQKEQKNISVQSERIEKRSQRHVK